MTTALLLTDLQHDYFHDAKPGLDRVDAQDERVARLREEALTDASRIWRGQHRPHG